MKKEFIRLNNYTEYLTKEEQEMYKFLYEKAWTKLKIENLETELMLLRARYKELSDPWIAKMLGITKQAVFCRRQHLLNKIKRCLIKK